MLRELILNTPREQRASVRAEEVFKVFNIEIKKPQPLIFEGKRKFQIIDIKRNESKIEVFARVFEGKKQLGFGDGTVDIERFVFVNPPLTVDDPEGDIIIPDYDIEGNRKQDIRLREDPIQAIHEALQRTVEVMKNKYDGSEIIIGKVGNTTTTIYSDAGDSVVRNSNATWSTMRNATAGSSLATTSPTYLAWEKEGSVYNGYQPFHMFDTSVISSGDTISSATFSIRQNGDSAVADSQQMTICNSTQATWNSIVTGDFDQRGGSIEGATRVNCPSGTATSFVDFPLNSTGLGFIARSGETIPASASASGKTQLCIRWSSDLDNSTPTGRTYMQVRMSEHTGTASDPVLVVEHSGAVSVTVNPTVLSSSFSLPSYNVSTSVSIAPNVLSATFTITPFTVTAIENVSITSSVLLLTLSIPAYSVSTNTSISSSILSATFSIPTYSVLTPDVLVLPSVLTATFNLPISTVTTTRSIDVLATVLGATFSIPSYTASGSDSIVIEATLLFATFSVPTYTPTATSGVTVSATTLTATFSVPTYTATGIENVSISASVLTGTFSIPTYAISLVQMVSSSALSATFTIPAYTVTAIQNVSLSPSFFALSFTIPTYFARGDFWQEKFSVPSTNWSDKGYNESNNWLNKY